MSPYMVLYKYWGNEMSVNLKADIKPISYIKTNAADMMKYVNENKNPIIITQNGEAKAVLMDVDSYQDMQNAFSLMGIIKEAEKEIERKDYKEFDVVFSELKNRATLK
jgi:prevent-host-death family protein